MIKTGVVFTPLKLIINLRFERNEWPRTIQIYYKCNGFLTKYQAITYVISKLNGINIVLSVLEGFYA